jgi:hypothetical protein
VDEAQAGFASKIYVILHEDDSVSISDDGRGVWCISFLTFVLSLRILLCLLAFPDSITAIDQYVSIFNTPPQAEAKMSRMPSLHKAE